MVRVARSVLTAVAFLLVFFAARTALALPIAFDPDGYTGTYGLVGSSSAAGPQTKDLAAGNYQIAISDCARLAFTVNADGTVATTSPAALDAGGNTVRFRTTTVTFDPGGYTGTYHLRTMSPAPRAGVSSEVVLKGLYNCPLYFGDQAMRFSTDADANITSMNPASATSLGATLRFNTVSVAIDPAAYTGTYHLGAVSPAPRSGLSNVTLVAGVTSYQIIMGGDFRFDVGGDGTVPSVPAATGGMATLRFNTLPVTFDTGAYTGLYNLGAASSANRTGVSTVELVKGAVYYQVSFGGTGFWFNITADGTVAPHRAAVGTGGVGTLHFNTVPITIDPAAYTGDYSLRDVSPTSRTVASTVHLVPDVFYYTVHFNGTGFYFHIAADGTVHPTNAANASVDGGTLRFNTVVISVDPGVFTGAYSFWGPTYPPSRTGPSSMVLVAGINNYTLMNATANQGAYFSVGAPCSVSPPIVTAGGVPFALRCGPLDETLPTLAFTDTPAITNQTSLTVAGSVQDAGGIASVALVVNGGSPIAVTPNADGTISAAVNLVEGLNELVLRATDAAGNVGATSTQIQLDTAPPALTLLAPSEGQAQGTTLVTVTAQVTDASATVVTIGGAEYPVPATGIVSATVDVGGEGERTLSLSARDAAGNTTTAAAHVLIDLAAPLAEIDLVDGARLGPLPDDSVPIAVRVDDAAATTVTFSFGATYPLPRGGGIVYVSAPLVAGQNTFTVTISSEVGFETTLVRTVVYDTEPPTASFVASAFVRGTADVSGTVTDLLTGVAGVSFRVDDGPDLAASVDGSLWTAVFNSATVADGVHTVTLIATDGVGNSATISGTLTVDNGAPLVSFSVPSGSVVSGTTTIGASADDFFSGVAELTLSVNGHTVAQCATATCSAPFDTTTLSGDGPFAVTATARDAAGNTTSATRELVADNTAPLHFITSPVDGATVMISTTLAVNVVDANFAHVVCAVDGAQIADSTSPTLTQNVDLSDRLDGAVVVTCTATDSAGNAGTETVTVNVNRSTETLNPQTLNLKSKGGGNSVTLVIDGPNASLLLASGAPPVALVVDSAVPVYATTTHATSSGITVKFDRQALIASIRAAMASGVSSPVTVRVFAGTREIGRDSINVIP